MLTIKKILCPVDFSEPSYEALRIAGELASNFSAELCVIHVVTENINFDGLVNILSLDVKSIQQRILEKYKKKLKKVIEKKVSMNVRVDPIVFEGNPAGDIVKIAELENPDIIVMATHGQTGWRHLVFGSVAEKVVRLTKYPVLTINAPQKQRRMMSQQS
ncbi:MAG: universal stress protein [Deltaproteobacteria bacterium]|uniref:Universal stress protein n=1 Tax=Candidatus Zymogenus saltonus TaxID=2844893 RepID=A0A9D8KEV8_9DELT|nr:universal stress protein [Candidatus Zymogenus saltonus]